MRRPPFVLASQAVTFAFLILFLVLPVVLILRSSVLTPDGVHLTLGNFKKIFAYDYYRAAVINTLQISAGATIAAIILGVPIAFCLARLPIPGKPLAVTLGTLPLLLPSFVSAHAWVLLLGRFGFLSQALRAVGVPFGSIYGRGGMIFVYTIQGFPYVLLLAMSAFSAIDVSLEEAGENLGSSPWRTFRTVTLPLLIPAMLSGGLLVFMASAENFGVPFVLAEDVPVLSVEAYKLFVSELGGNPGLAGAMGVFLILCTAVPLLLQRAYLRRQRFATQTRGRPRLLTVSPGVRRLTTVLVFGVDFVALLPFLVVIVASFLEMRGPVMFFRFSLQSYREILTQSPEMITNTYLLATLGTLVAVVLGVPIGYLVTRQRLRSGTVLETLSNAPLAIAGTVLGIGFVLAFNTPPLILTGSWIILVLAYTTRMLPFNVRSTVALLHQLDPAMEEASINLGVPPGQTFVRVTVRLLLAGIVSGAILTWVNVASELSSTVILYSGPWATMTVGMFQAMESRNLGVASAFASILVVSVALPLLFVTRLFGHREVSLV
ncbi:MAG TPA: iron ABC transporter permease [Candidatus Acidoferrum sp.]|nr:iron ABC transporter permease [Candidatus Methylomirabilis sp.]HWU38287.1 iron ABC transporter permease [Candidatus Acidoferrum sp.]